MVESERSKLEQKLELLKQSYQHNLQEELTSLCHVLKKAQRREESPEADVVSSAVSVDDKAHDETSLDAIYRRIHKVSGSAGTFGFEHVSQLARALEVTLLNALKEGKSSLDASLVTLLQSQLTLMQRSLVPEAQPLPQCTIEQSDIRSVAKIWLIEEDALLGKRILEQLANFSYEVTLFSSVPAIANTDSEPPDVLIVDAAAGSAYLSPLQSLSCPLFFISEQDDFDARMRAAQLNAYGYFLKPLNIPQLVNRLEQLLQERHAPPARILIVDDDYQLAAYYQLVLEAAGMEVQVLDKPRYVIEQLTTYRPELLLMDVHMPDYNGPDIAAMIRQYDAWSSLPIVFLSAELDLNKQVDALSHGADEFLTKPISAAQLVASVRARVSRSRTLSALLNKDCLTGLLKHASIKSAAIDELHRAARQHYPVTVAMIDIDHFKAVNDTHGHAAGDVVIASLATLLRQRLRQTDMIGRYGGEEFLVVLPHCTSEDGRKRLENIREYFSRLRFNQGAQEFGCTLSAGMVCSIDMTEGEQDRLLVRADEALYRAKRGGRNQVCQ
ncbi:diguanylate cyclase [Halomonas sp. TD01]|uniref:diguanylate cyclase n=1 Tax=Halomonas sp. TD01 TaxID=999141 RepID=UPI000214F955|nr:diguanylate cyclase [Halomonas sp. TD01]EGP19387.1 response regulator receiver modulated diguanylate cyclase [Halomonas sp. TD01]CAH1044971.1 hypothetical protein HPTD01_3449 [Halomonas sp. TD01]